MSIVSAFTVFLYLAFVAAFMQQSRGGRPIAMAIGVLHLAAAFFVIVGSRGDYSNTDARLYYYDSENYMLQAFNLGTAFVARLTVAIANTLGATFEDMMLFYSLSGLVAILLLLQQHLKLLRDQPLPLFVLPIYLLPGFHFWTSPIGKDGLAVLGLTLIATFARDLKANWGTVLVGLIVLTLVRPHIGFLMVAAYGLMKAFNLRDKGSIILVILLLPVGVVLARVIFLPLVGVDIFDVGAVLRFFTDRTDFLLTTSTVRVQYIDNPVLRVLGFMFLPLFDFSNLLTLTASAENLVLIAVVVRLAMVSRTIAFFEDDHARFLLLSFVGILLLVGLGNYNVGLGLRQKTMVYPSLVTLLLLGEIANRRRRTATKSEPLNAEMATA